MTTLTKVRSSEHHPVTEEVDGYRTLIEDFLDSKSQHTHRAYKRDLESFADWLRVDTPREALRTLIELGHGKANQVVIQYKNDLRAEGLAPATINRRLSAIRSLIGFGQVVGFIDWSLNVGGIKVTPLRDTRGPGKVAIKAMQEAAKDRKDSKGIRDYAILRLLFDVALRRGEVIGLDMKDLELEADRLWIHGKGRSEKEKVTLPPETVKALKAWIEVRGDHPGPLFNNFDHAGKGNGRLSGQAIYYITKSYGEKVEAKRCHPHGFRHSAITEAIRLTNGNVNAVAAFSRHLSLEMVRRYDDNRKDRGGKVARQVAACI